MRLRPRVDSVILVIAVAIGVPIIAAQSGASDTWWAAGQGTPLPAYAAYDNERGQVGVLNTSGPYATKGHPFFEPLGSNGRACVTCHQPADAMSLSVRSIRAQWEA